VTETFDTSAGQVEVEFGINRWVLVSVGGDEGQEQVETAQQLADYLGRRGLSGPDAARVAESAWAARPEDASVHAVSAREGPISATGFTGGVIALMALAFVLVYFFFLR
jgi:hypothetical protein